MQTNELKDELLIMKARLLRRIGKIEIDKGRVERPLETDVEDQAIDVQNDEVIDQLDESTRREMIQIDSALERIRRGNYGLCLKCGAVIDKKRLTALPYAETCIDCSRG